MGNSKKYCIIDYTLDEFLEKYRIERETFNKNLKIESKKKGNFFDYYDISSDDLKKEKSEKKANYEIQYDIADLLNIMIDNFENKNIKSNGYNDDVTITEILKDNNRFISSIEKLPEYQQFYIKNKLKNYEFISFLNEIVPVLIERISILISIKLFDYENEKEMIRIILHFLDDIDLLIDKHFESNELMKQEINEDSNDNELTYNAEELLSECFKKFKRSGLKEFNEVISEEMINSLLNYDSNENVDELREKYIEVLNKSFVIKFKQDEWSLEKEINIYRNHIEMLKKVNKFKFDERILKVKEENARIEKDEIIKYLDYKNLFKVDIRMNIFIDELKKSLRGYDISGEYKNNYDELMQYLYGISYKSYEKLSEESKEKLEIEIDKLSELMVKRTGNAYKNKCKKIADDRNKIKLIEKFINQALGKIYIDIIEEYNTQKSK
mgnify:CR=1 FL=1